MHTPARTAADPASIRAALTRHGQGHVLRFEAGLSPAQRDALYRQVAAIDLEELDRLIARYVLSDEQAPLPPDLEPAPYYPCDENDPVRPWDRARYRAIGEGMLADGRVACFTVAGGQGSRLGYDGPKGCYPTGCVTAKPLFKIFAESILATQLRYGAPVPWYIMTSPLNHAATSAFFVDNDHFGLDPGLVRFFPQGTMPSLDLATGRMLMASRGEVATNPDGHGGAFRALVESGSIADMKSRGVTQISYFQVDNPHAPVADPVFMGLHAAAPESSGEMSSKMVRKAHAGEKVGVFCRSGPRAMVIEYSDMPRELAEAIDAAGRLRYNAGSIAIHAISVEFVEKIVNDPEFELPYHRAVKSVPHIDPSSGEPVEPGVPNAVKLERFVFDAIPLAGGSIVLEVDRTEEFAPVKNKHGPDSIVSSRALQTERAVRWLRAAGVEVPMKADGTPDCTIEISPLTALSADQLAEREDLPGSIRPGSVVCI